MLCDLFCVLSATVWCVEYDCTVCVLFGVLIATVWCVYCSVCWERMYGVCTVQCVECDYMVCVQFGVLSATVWCVKCDRMVCVLFGVLIATVWCVYCSVCWVRLYGVCVLFLYGAISHWRPWLDFSVLSGTITGSWHRLHLSSGISYSSFKSLNSPCFAPYVAVFWTVSVSLRDGRFN